MKKREYNYIKNKYSVNLADAIKNLEKELDAYFRSTFSKKEYSKKEYLVYKGILLSILSKEALPLLARRYSEELEKRLNVFESEIVVDVKEENIPTKKELLQRFRLYCIDTENNNQRERAVGQNINRTQWEFNIGDFMVRITNGYFFPTIESKIFNVNEVEIKNYVVYQLSKTEYNELVTLFKGDYKIDAKHFVDIGITLTEEEAKHLQ